MHQFLVNRKRSFIFVDDESIQWQTINDNNPTTVSKKIPENLSDKKGSFYNFQEHQQPQQHHQDQQQRQQQQDDSTAEAKKNNKGSVLKKISFVQIIGFKGSQKKCKLYYAIAKKNKFSGALLLKLKKLTIKLPPPPPKTSSPSQITSQPTTPTVTSSSNSDINTTTPTKITSKDERGDDDDYYDENGAPISDEQTASLILLIQSIEDILNEKRKSRPSRVLIYVNPFGGKGRALHLYKTQVRRLFELANVEVKLIITKYANHARDTIEDPQFNVEYFDGIICVGGDGMFSELMNGLLFRYNREKILLAQHGISSISNSNSGDSTTTNSDDKHDYKQQHDNQRHTHQQANNNHNDDLAMTENYIPDHRASGFGQLAKNANMSDDESKGTTTTNNPQLTTMTTTTTDTTDLTKENDDDKSVSTIATSAAGAESEDHQARRGRHNETSNPSENKLLTTSTTPTTNNKIGNIFTPKKITKISPSSPFPTDNNRQSRQQQQQQQHTTSPIDKETLKTLRLALGGIGKQFITPPIPVGVIGAGSTDANSFGLIGTNDVITATLNIILGHQINIDICSIHSIKEDKLLKFVSTFVAYGYFGDVVRESEKLRWLGPSRYDVSGLNNLIKNRTYNGLVRILVSQKDGTPIESERCHKNCELCCFDNQKQQQHHHHQQQQQSSSSSIITKSSCHNNNHDYKINDFSVIEKEGSFMGVNAAVTACRCPQTKKGFSPNNHLANGCADLILVLPCSRWQYIQYLLRTGFTKKSAFDLKFVEAYRCRQFEFLASESEEEHAHHNNHINHNQLNHDGGANCDQQINRKNQPKDQSLRQQPSSFSSLDSAAISAAGSSSTSSTLSTELNQDQVEPEGSISNVVSSPNRKRRNDDDAVNHHHSTLTQEQQLQQQPGVLRSSWNVDGEILDEQSIRVKVNNQLLRVFGTGEP